MSDTVIKFLIFFTVPIGLFVNWYFFERSNNKREYEALMKKTTDKNERDLMKQNPLRWC